MWRDKTSQSLSAPNGYKMLIENPAEGLWPLGSTRRRQQLEPLVLCVTTNSPEPPLGAFWCLGTREDSVR